MHEYTTEPPVTTRVKIRRASEHRGWSHIRHCGHDVLRMLALAGPLGRGGGGIPHRIVTISVTVSCCG